MEGQGHVKLINKDSGSEMHREVIYNTVTKEEVRDIEKDIHFVPDRSDQTNNQRDNGNLGLDGYGQSMKKTKSTQRHVAFHENLKRKIGTENPHFHSSPGFVHPNSLQKPTELEGIDPLKAYQAPEKIGRLRDYRDEEEGRSCRRFPHMIYCGCKVQFDPKSPMFQPIHIIKNIYIGPIQSAYNTKTLLREGITHILNVSSIEYTKRKKYFKYYNLDVYNTHDEDIKKLFRITNRFITQALNKGGKVLIHSENGISRAPAFTLAFMINCLKITLRKGLGIMTSRYTKVDINDYFKKQLEEYDLEKLAIISTSKDNNSEVVF